MLSGGVNEPEMINAILLILAPIRTWEGIFLARRSVGFIFTTYLLPILLISCFVEGYGLVRWGKWQGEVAHLVRFTRGEAVVFEVLQFVGWLLLVVINAAMLKSTSGTFHGRQTFTQGFRTIAYGMGPLFLFRCLNGFSEISPWISWFVGILFTLAALYHGVPKIMDPDPAHAFGLYVVTSLLLVFTTGLLQLVTALELKGQFPKLTTLISDLAARLPF
jgi:hypothetical protein